MWRGNWYEGKHEPIFLAAEWERLKGSFGLKATQRVLKHQGLFATGPLTLSCAADGCGCKVTYAPKTKPSGVTYSYYRCLYELHIGVGTGKNLGTVAIGASRIDAAENRGVEALGSIQTVLRARTHVVASHRRALRSAVDGTAPVGAGAAPSASHQSSCSTCDGHRRPPHGSTVTPLAEGGR